MLDVREYGEDEQNPAASAGLRPNIFLHDVTPNLQQICYLLILGSLISFEIMYCDMGPKYHPLIAIF